MANGPNGPTGLALNLRPWRGSVAAPRWTGASHGPRQRTQAVPRALGPGAVLGTRAWKRSARKAQQTEVRGADVKGSPLASPGEGGSESGSETGSKQGEVEETQAFLSDEKALDAQILSLALPSLIALCAEPVLSIIDTGFVGRLPNAPLCLGGLGPLEAFRMFIH